MEKINTDIIAKLQFSQWRNSYIVLKWFNNIIDKSNCSFIQFDILPVNNREHSTPKTQICKTAYQNWQKQPTHYKLLSQVVTIFW